MASVPTYNPNDPAGRGRARRAQPRHHRHLRAGLDHEDVHHRGGAGRGRGQAGRPVRLPDGADDGGQVHHPRHPPARRADGRPRCSSSRATSARPRSRASWAAIGWRTRWRASASAIRRDRAARRARRASLRPVAKWGDIGFANVSFGQGLTVTPLQMVTGVAAIAGGRHLPAAAHRHARRAGRRHASRRCPARPSAA